MIDNNLTQKARVFATAAHAAIGQRRNYTGEPYIVHPAAVVRIVMTVRHTPEMVAAAWLHDVVEDTEIGIETIRHEFGDVVADLVAALTDEVDPNKGNGDARRAINRARLAAAPHEAQTIKLADLIDNTRNIVELNPGYAPKYLGQKAALLEEMRGGDEALRAIALSQILGFGPSGGTVDATA